MLSQISETYLASFDHALDVAEQIDLPGATIIEPSRFTAFVCTCPKDAVHFALRFDGVRWLDRGPAMFLAAAPAAFDEVRAWAGQNSNIGHPIEMVAVLFCSAHDQQRFEAAL